MNKDARTRTLYTGEPYSTALQRLHGYRSLTRGLVPDADPQQARLEAAFLTALCAGDGAEPHGIKYASPTPTVAAVVFHPEHVADAARAVLPHRDADGRLHGVPGLRWSHRRGAHTPDGSMLLLGPENLWRAAAARLRDEPGYLHGAPAGAEEREAFRALATGADPTTALRSRALRRIGLVPGRARRRLTLAELERLDFDGPAPAHIAPRRPARPGTVIELTGTHGGAGTTTLAVHLADALARDGVRAVVCECAEHYQSDLFELLDRPAPDGWLWTAVDRRPGGGTFALARLDPRPAAGLEQMAELRTQFDVVLLDSGFECLRDETIRQSAHCRYAVTDVGVARLTTREPADPRHVPLLLRKEIVDWLSGGWGARREELQDAAWEQAEDPESADDDDDLLEAAFDDEGGDEADGTEDPEDPEVHRRLLELAIELDRAGYARKREAFLRENEEYGSKRFGSAWPAAVGVFVRRDERRARAWLSDHAPGGTVTAERWDWDWDDHREWSEEELDQDERELRSVTWVSVPLEPAAAARSLLGKVGKAGIDLAGCDGLIATQVRHPMPGPELLDPVRAEFASRSLNLLATMVPHRAAFDAANPPGTSAAMVKVLTKLGRELLAAAGAADSSGGHAG